MQDYAAAILVAACLVSVWLLGVATAPSIALRLCAAIGATVARGSMTRERIALLVVIATEIGVFLIDLFLVPRTLLPAAPYAVPILVAALYLSPLIVAATSAGALALQVSSAFIAESPATVWPLFSVGVALTGALATLLADRRVRLAALAEERQQLAEREAAARAEAEARATELEALRQVTDPALGRQGLDVLVQSLLQRTIAIMRADAGAIMLLDPARQELGLTVTAGIPAEQVTGLRVRVGEDFVGRVIEQNAIIGVPDIQADPTLSSPILRASHIRALLGAPLPVRREVIGAIYVGFLQVKRFEPSEELLLSVVAERAAQAIYQAQLLKEAREAQGQTARSLEAEQQARRQAEEAVRARDSFLAATAHELRTPITSLRGYAELTIRRLQREEVPDPERTRLALSAIDRQSERLARLVQQLLDVASIEASQLELHRQETDLAPLVRDLVNSVQAGARRHTLSLQAPVSLRALIDPQRIRNVVANLLDNAVRFSPPGTQVEIELTAPGPDTVRLTVRDHGPGIPPALRPQLFSRFFQAQRGRPFAGLGLGLYVGRHIVALHGGTLTAEFPEDGGSRFVLTLPVGLPKTPEPDRRKP